MTRPQATPPIQPTAAAPAGVAAARSGHAIGIALGAGGAILFSTRAILIKLAYAYQVDPITFLTLRMVFALPFFIFAALWAQRSTAAAAEPLGARDKWSIFGLGLLAYYFASYVDFVGLHYISAALARLIAFLNPTLTILIMALFFADRKSTRLNSSHG